MKQDTLVQEFPALAGVSDRVRMVNAVIDHADLVDDGDGAALLVTFKLANGGGVIHRLATFALVQKLFRVAGKWSLADLNGAAVRVEIFSQASWCPFFRVWHFVDDENLLLRYDASELERYTARRSASHRS